MIKSIKNEFRKIIRSSLACKNNERISDAIDRHLTHIRRNFIRSKVTKSDIANSLIRMGVKEGDVIMVHASWRKFYNFEGTPSTLIDILLKVIGPNGTLLMPCYGNDKTFFDVNNTPSYAGVLSEEFRKMKGVIRSECSHFSVCAYGKDAEELTRKHKGSVFGFDSNSPYYLFSQLDNGKIIKFGMGKYPIKMTLIHCIEYVFKDIYPYFRDYLTVNYEATVVDRDGIKHTRKMVEGIGGKLYRKNIKKIYKSIPKNLCHYERVHNIDIRVFSAYAGYQEIVKAVRLGKSMLNPPRAKRGSFIPIK